MKVEKIVLSDDVPEVLRPSEVAAIFRVDPKTVARWAKTGKLDFFRTPAGHRRYKRADVEAALNFATFHADFDGEYDNEDEEVSSQ